MLYSHLVLRGSRGNIGKKSVNIIMLSFLLNWVQTKYPSLTKYVKRIQQRKPKKQQKRNKKNVTSIDMKLNNVNSPKLRALNDFSL